MRTSYRVLAPAAVLSLAVAAAPVASAQLDTGSLLPPSADCKVDTAALAKATPPPAAISDFEGWVVGETGNLCGNLGYIFLETPMGTKTSPTKVLLLHRGKKTTTQPAGEARTYLGVHSDFHVELKVQQPPKGDEPNAALGTRSVYYVWNPLVSDATAIALPF